MTIEELQQQIQLVAKARQAATEASNIQRNALDKWQMENSSLIMKNAETKAVVEVEEAKLRELTLAFYAETGNKKPLPEVGVRVGKRLEYRADQALDWAIDHELALKLDVSTFEGLVKSTPGSFPFVTIEDVPNATIATNIEIKEESK